MLLTAGNAYAAKSYDELSATGVPVFAGFNGYLTWAEMKKLVTSMGVAVRREDAAAELNARTEDRLLAIKDRLSALGSLPSVTLLRTGENGVVYNQVDALLDALGFPGDRATSEEFTRTLTAEELDQVTSDVIIVGAFQDQQDVRAQLAMNPLWERLPAVRSGGTSITSTTACGGLGLFSSRHRAATRRHRADLQLTPSCHLDLSVHYLENHDHGQNQVLRAGHRMVRGTRCCRHGSRVRVRIRDRGARMESNAGR